jgi:hypothetical protein
VGSLLFTVIAGGDGKKRDQDRLGQERTQREKERERTIRKEFWEGKDFYQLTYTQNSVIDTKIKQIFYLKNKCLLGSNAL